MAIQISCSCGRQLKLADELAGKRIRCPDCAAALSVPQAEGRSPLAETTRHRPKPPTVPGPAPTRRPSSQPARKSGPPTRGSSKPEESEGDWLSDLPSSAWEQPSLPRRTGRAGPTRAGSRSSAGKNASGLSFTARLAIIGAAVVGMPLLAGIGGALLKGRAGGPVPAALPDVTQATISTAAFPPRPAFQPAFPSGVQLARTRLAGTGPAGATQMNVYLPAGTHAERSLGCVLVAPAGTNLLVGNSLDGDDYHDETLPYAEAGYLTIQYSLDGPVADLEQSSDAEMGAAYALFRAAGAGTLNTRSVMEFVKARFPEVDPTRIYTAGHSSAGTVSLLAAEFFPQIAGCIAFAPCSDVEAFHADIRGVPGVNQLLPGLAEFDRRFSPSANVAELKCPLFIFQALDDSVVEASETRRFAERARQHNSQVEYIEVATGEHYDSMIGAGIPAAVQWLKRVDRVKAAP